MGRSFDQNRVIRQRLSREVGTIFKGGGDLRVAMLYPSPYRAGMSSLGFQTIYRIINTETEHVAERSFLPDEKINGGALLTYESQSPVGDFDVIAVSLAYELEVAGLIKCFKRIGVEPLAAKRTPYDPLVILGGPITFSNPLPYAPFVDIIVLGEGESPIKDLLDNAANRDDRDRLLDDLAGWEGVFVPSRQDDSSLTELSLARADERLLPAHGQIVTPDAELSNMHLVEAARGCHRRCTFCVMRRAVDAGMRAFSKQRVLATIPEHASRVGLVGAAVTDHPKLEDIAEAIVRTGRGLGISSLRADRLTPRLVEILVEGGYRTLTVAADGASQRLRKQLQKGISSEHLIEAARLAAKHGLSTLKLYAMVGVPSETTDDIKELIETCRELSQIIPVALAISPFVSKRNTPLDGHSFAGIDVVNDRLRQVERGLKGRVKIRSTSAKWGWVEHRLAQGGPEMAKVAIQADAAGGNFAAWRAAIEERTSERVRASRRGRREAEGAEGS